MRVHSRFGAELASVCAESMTVVGSVEDWEQWTGMRFSRSENRTIPGALVPVRIDLESDSGLYVEPNVWMVHPLARA